MARKDTVCVTTATHPTAFKIQKNDYNPLIHTLSNDCTDATDLRTEIDTGGSPPSPADALTAAEVTALQGMLLSNTEYVYPDMTTACQTFKRQTATGSAADISATIGDWKTQFIDMLTVNDAFGYGSNPTFGNFKEALSALFTIIEKGYMTTATNQMFASPFFGINNNSLTYDILIASARCCYHCRILTIPNTWADTTSIPLWDKTDTDLCTNIDIGVYFDSLSASVA